MSAKTFVAALSLLILQAGIGPLLTVSNARPSFLLPFIVYLSLHSGSLWGCVIGFALGLGVDALGDLPLGISALAFSIAGFFAVRLSKDAPFRLLWPWSALVLLFALVLEFLRIAVLARANQLPFVNLMLWAGVPSALWTTGLAVLWFLSPLHKRDGALR